MATSLVDIDDGQNDRLKSPKWKGPGVKTKGLGSACRLPTTKQL